MAEPDSATMLTAERKYLELLERHLSLFSDKLSVAFSKGIEEGLAIINDSIRIESAKRHEMIIKEFDYLHSGCDSQREKTFNETDERHEKRLVKYNLIQSLTLSFLGSILVIVFFSLARFDVFPPTIFFEKLATYFGVGLGIGVALHFLGLAPLLKKYYGIDIINGVKGK